jgi:dolichol-phosphate mannosyltransferase
MAMGSRYVKGGRIQGWPLKRWVISRGANLLAQVMLRSRIRDLTGGFKCFTRQALEQIDLNRVASEGYIFQVEMNHLARCEQLTIKQIPICFTDRKQVLRKWVVRKLKGSTIMAFGISGLVKHNKGANMFSKIHYFGLCCS